MKDFLSQAGKLLKEHKQYKRQLTVFLCLAVIVAFGTVTALKLYGQAMTHKVEVLDCQYQVHQHTEDCYAKDEQGNPGTELICGYADYVVHTHNEDCYDSKGNLVCGLEEHEKHEHTDECFTTELVLVCGLEEVIPEESPENETVEESKPEAAGQPETESEPIQEEVLICQSEVHAHSEGCYETALVCGREEHVHGEGCTSQELACGAEEHAHGEGCYDEEGNLICEVQEHAHEETCYTTVNVCGAEEHTHGDECYTTNLICGIEEHEHTESCYELVTVPAPADNGTTEPAEETPVADETAGEGSGEPTEPESEPEGHVHTEACYEEVKTLVCEEQELHIHDNSCYEPECFDENGTLIEGSQVSCGLLQLEEHTHVHTEGEDSCFKTVELTPEEVAALENGATLHIHEESCYDEEGNLICGHDATHIHMPECYDDAGELICGYGTASHVHEDKCYDENGELVCGYETATHVHEDSCYDADGNLQCGYEAASHVHEDSCYDEDGKLVCGYETATHVHEDSCYDADGNLQCGYETASHVHEDSCYDADGNLQCGYETASHVHEDSCYDEEGNLVCGYETASHVHKDSCYDEEGNLVCGYKTASHPHTESCYDEDGNLICGYETATHTHNASCYDEEGNLVCGYASAIHEHDESCYDEEGNLICGYNEKGLALSALYCNEQVHQHEADCYDEEGNLVCGKADYVAHTHTDECYNVEGKRICPLPEVHVHSEDCYPEETEGEAEPEPICGEEEVQLHTHTEECYDENGTLTCGQLEILEHVHSEACQVSNQSVTKTFANESFIITAVYNRNANIPEEAELKGEQITQESDEEHYANREAEYQAIMGNKKATMRALLKIGFYMDDIEIEPETPVMITVQFLDENGLEEGSPITIVHFGEKGTEVLDGSDAVDGKTTFKMESFSELAIGYGKVGDVVTVPISDSIDYNTDAFNIKFHIEGDITVPISDMEKRDAENGENGEASSLENGQMNEDNVQAEVSDDEIDSNGDFRAIVEIDELEGDLFFTVKPLEEESEEYIAVSTYATETGVDEGMLSLQVLSYSLVYAGEKLELDGCVVTVEITPTEALVEYAEEPIGIMAIDGDATMGETEIENEVLLMALDLEMENEDFIVEGVREVVSVNKEAMNAPITYEMNPTGTEGTVAHVAASQANPKFTVKYYATLDIVKKDIKGDVDNQPIVINTDTTLDGEMPKNKKMNLSTLYLSTEAAENGKYKIATESELIEVYKEKEYQFIKAPGLIYVDSLAKNDNYKLVQIKKCTVNEEGKVNEEVYNCCELKCNKQHTHTEDCYEGEKEWYFTNKSETQNTYPNDFILIEEGAVLELVYVVTTDTPSNDMYFYDYDISDGKLYNNADFNENGPTGATVPRDGKSHISGSTWYMYTDKQGINSLPNQNLGFGNSSSQARTTLGETFWDGNLLNRANNNYYQLAESYGGCTFGLTTRLKEDGTIQYAPGVIVPNLFNEGAAVGKTEYEGSLIFDRSGDTYTLTATKVTDKENNITSEKTGLTQFTSIPNWNNTRTIWTNSYYPLDEVSSAGGDGHDLMFGEEGKEKFLQSFAKEEFIKIDPKFGTKTNEGRTQTVPTSDDKGNHNHYFGMWYTVEFDLTEDYIGPLEYIFYGDDDMWVFLDGNGKKARVDENGEPVVDGNGNPIIDESSKDGQLICDIGGVHSAVGEYVNLWNYIEKGTTGHYTLSFFYTERGASGSTCWMQFTLPSVSFITPKQTTGQLQVEKEVTGSKTDDEFGFTIKFYSDSSKTTPLMHNYSYEKVRYLLDEQGNILKDEQGNPRTEFVSNDVLIWDGACFTLKANESILISYIPDGAYFEINEVGPVIANKDGDRLKYLEDGTPDWVVLDDSYTADITGGLSSNGKTVTGVINLQDKEIVKIHYNNVYAFTLPETGGSGTILYTMAGGIVLLFGAGFLYKKKFRERRG